MYLFLYLLTNNVRIIYNTGPYEKQKEQRQALKTVVVAVVDMSLQRSLTIGSVSMPLLLTLLARLAVLSRPTC